MPDNQYNRPIITSLLMTNGGNGMMMSDGNLDQPKSMQMMTIPSNYLNRRLLWSMMLAKSCLQTRSVKTNWIFQPDKIITFNLEKSGIHKSAEAPEAPDETKPLFPYTAILEMEYAGEHCFLLILDQKGDRPPFLDQSDPEMNALYEKIPGVIYRSWMMNCIPSTQITGGIHALIGFLPEDLVENKKISYLALVHPEDLESFKSALADAVEQDKTFDIVYRLRHSDGVFRTVRDQGRAQKNSHGAVQTIEGWLVPIASEKKVEEELAESETRYRNLIDVSPDAVVYTDENGLIKLANKQFARMLEIEDDVDLTGVNALRFLSAGEGTPRIRISSPG